MEQARSIADQQALDLATAEHERIIPPLRAKAATLASSSDAARAGIQDTARTLKEYKARLKSIEAQKRSNAAVIAVVERNHATYISQLCAHSRRPPPVHAASQPPTPTKPATFVAPAAQQPLAPAKPATFVVPAAQQPSATANLATFIVPAATQPPAPATSAVPTALAATQLLGTTASAAARPSATTAPAVTFYARPNMSPPAPREPSTSTTPWSVVVSRTHRQPPYQPPYAAHDDSYLDLRISKLMLKNKHFPFDLRLPIKDFASNVNTALALLLGGRSRLRFALQLATQDRPPLCDGLVDGILHPRDLLERAYATLDGARWVRETLRDAAAPHRLDRTESSTSDSSTTTGQRLREEPSSGRGNSKRANLSGTSDSDSRQHPRRAGRDRLGKRQVPPRIFHAAEQNDRDALPLPPRISRHREHAHRLPSRVAETSAEYSPGADSPLSMQHTVEAATATAIAAVDCHLAHMGLCPRSEPVSSHDVVNNTRPLVASASVATPPPPAGSVTSTAHPAVVSTNNAYPFVAPASVAMPPPPAGSVAPTAHPVAVSTNNAYSFVAAPAPVSAPLPPADSVAPTANPRPGPIEDCPPPCDLVRPCLKRPPSTGPH